LAEVFKWLSPACIKELSQTNIIDVGSGPGTFSLAWLNQFEQQQEITLIETSELMKAQARQMLNFFYPNILINEKLRKKEKQTMVFGHSYNEIGFTQSYRLIKEASPDFVLIIEPGTKEVFVEILKLRNKMIEEGYEIIFPCLKNSACPLTDSTEDWCHQFLYTKYDND